jgi:hypothetical protein
MKTNITTARNAVFPQCFITKKKQRVKQYNDTVFLENGDEFELEVFNPLNHKISASIQIDGKEIGSSNLVLRPGERVFLERYLNEAKKFMYETYMVDSSSSEVQNAIKNNGKVVVKFYYEYLYYYTNTTITNVDWNNNITYQQRDWAGRPINRVYFNTTSTGHLDGTVPLSNSISSTSTSDFFIKRTLSEDVVETGIVSKGSNSDQKFTYDNTYFSPYVSHTVEWNIKPRSTKPITTEDLAVFCTECGAKRKKDTFRFCPHCGTKF